jgi:GNAT superfamily N-acetyltransferase
MSESELDVKINPMTVWDIENLLALDQSLRESDVSLTYSGFSPIRHAFSMQKEDRDFPQSTNLLLVMGLIELGFVAELEGSLIGFIVGRQTYLTEYNTKVGEIAMIGINPVYRGKGIGKKLINALTELFRSKGINRVRIGINPMDKELMSFFEKEGYSGERIVYYSKAL